MKKKINAEDYDFFQQYVFEMDDILEEFILDVDLEGSGLDYSLSSLDIIERLFVALAYEPDERVTENRAARYLGEVFRRNVGGHWALCDDDPLNMYYGLPVLTGFSEVPADFCPLAVVGNFLYGKRAGLLKGAVEANVPFAKNARSS